MSAIAPEVVIYPLPLSKIAHFLEVSVKTLRKYSQGLCLDDPGQVRDRQELLRLIRAFAFCKRGSRGGRGGTQYTPWEYAAIEVACTDQETGEVVIEALDTFLIQQHKIKSEEIYGYVARVFEGIGERVDRSTDLFDTQNSDQGLGATNWEPWTV